MIDAHIHLEQYEPEVAEQILSELPDMGIKALIAVSMNLDSCIRTQRLAAINPGVVRPAYGFHPEQPLPQDAELAALLKWIESQSSEDYIAVGKSGCLTIRVLKL